MKRVLPLLFFSTLAGGAEPLTTAGNGTSILSPIDKATIEVHEGATTLKKSRRVWSMCPRASSRLATGAAQKK